MSLSFETIRAAARGKVLEVTLDRPARQNTLTARMIDELHAALDAAEANDALRLMVLRGEGDTFCAGMDFAEATRPAASTDDALDPTVRGFWRLMQRFTASPVVVAALVTGRVTAGGLGLVAAADYVIAGPEATFQLSEVIFGLLPATVAPFIVRRCGLHQAYRLSLTAQRIDGARALAIGLVDEMADDPADRLRQFLVRIARVDAGCVGALKAYFQRLWIIDHATEAAAVEAITGRIRDPATMEGIRRFVTEAAPAWRK